ncbi:carbohydrate ABC transporter permease [Micromonospora sp. WMMD1128]|uniref:carbohydrate ABC transporter permease n=1 Tax=unclassified Micromonospora TaxID=2617518 RepID=UPI00248B48C2|nr:MULTISPECIES: carbohydrate ABC transporter permease [unclassified Micromonospora]WBB73847.1 carbohydrate ABC transporter permease [Micromonospora sp. WMMD1128]WFE32748.1 carbohydrate ABC transporter permease [Micromonospora sp. WMMD975]
MTASIQERPAATSVPRPARPRTPRRERRALPVYYLILIALAVFALGPIVALLFNAFKNNAEIGANPLSPPTSLSLSNFAEAWTRGDFATTMLNSAILCLGSVVGTCFVAGMAAYALSHLNVRGGNGVVAYLFLTSALPVQLFVVPLFFMWTNLGLTDTRPGLILIYIATDAPFAALLLRSFLLKIPHDFTEAARLDGASDWQIAWRIVLPLAWPGLLTVALIVGLWSWNEFFWAITFIHDPDLRPISTSFMAFQDQYSTDWGLTSAAAIFMLGPVLLLFLLLQRKFVAGLTSGGVK